MIKIKINNLQVFAFHGVLSEEKKNGQTFEIDIELMPAIQVTQLNDDISKTINYSDVVDFVVEKFTEETTNLIETVALKLAKEIRIKFNGNSVQISVRKPNAPLNHNCDSVEVEVHVSKEDL